MRAYLEKEFYYGEIAEYNFDIEYLDMMDYTLRCFDMNAIIESNGEIVVVRNNVDISKIDLDAIRWKLGLILSAELKMLYNKFYGRCT